MQEVAERAQLLVREEIELAKAEVTAKLTKLAKGGAIGAAAAVFVLGALILILHGLAWFVWWLLPISINFVWVGFFTVALVLLVIAGIAGYLASRLFKAGAPPTPDLAIEEAQAIKQTVDAARH